MPTRMLRNWTSSEKVDRLSSGAEVFFTRLIMTVDDYGRFHANPKLLKSALFPLREVKLSDIEKWLSECGGELLTLYTVDGKPYLQVIDFNQRLRLKTSKFPDMSDECPSNDRQVSDECPLEVETETEVETEVELPPKHSLIIWLEENCKRVQKMKEPLTDLDAELIVTEFDRTAIIEVFEAMDNSPKLKDYISAVKTFKGWLKVRQKSNPNFGIKTKSVAQPAPLMPRHEDMQYINAMKQIEAEKAHFGNLNPES